MSDSPSDPTGGRPARPAIPPFRGPAGAGRPGAPRPQLTPRGGAAIPPGGTRPLVRPAVSPTPPASARPVAPLRATPASAPRPPEEPVTPVVTPRIDETVSPIGASDVGMPWSSIEPIAPETQGTGDPLAGLEVLDTGTPTAIPPEVPPPEPEWLSPSTAIRGEFGDLVDDIPAAPTAEAPVFPTPPAPWPSVSPADVVPPSVEDFPEFDAVIDETAATSEGTSWSAGYEAESAAIHGDLGLPVTEAGPQRDSWGFSTEIVPGATDPGPQEPASYLASEWPEPARGVDPSMLPTPVVSMPSVLPPPPPNRDTPPTDASELAGPAGEWRDAPAGTGMELAEGEDWAISAASDLGRPEPTASSLATAEALERVAAQLREGTLRADGFSPALGEAAALSAALAALLGVDARWDVRR